MTTWFRMLLLTTGTALLMTGAVDAQVVDVRPAANAFLDTVAGVVGTALTITLGILSRWMLSRTGMSNSELERHLADRLNDVIHKGIDFALSAAKNEVNKSGSGLEAVKFDNYFLSLAASYIVKSAPDILRKFTITQSRLEDMIMARMSGYVIEVPITGGASATPMVKAVNQQTNLPVPRLTEPVMVRPVTVDATEPDKRSQVPGFTGAPDTGK